MILVSGSTPEAKEHGRRLRELAKEPIDPEDFRAMQKIWRSAVERVSQVREGESNG